MDTTLIENFDEKKCKTLLDLCAKRAYGKSAEFMFSYGGHPMVNIKGQDFYLIPFISMFNINFNNFNTSFDNAHCPSYKTILKKMMSFLKLGTDYISYLNNRPHFLDGNMSIESFLVEADLMEFNNE